jgi:hypothetical protein
MTNLTMSSIRSERGSAFLCAMTGIEMPVLENSAAYIAGWLWQIRDGSARAVVRAAGMRSVRWSGWWVYGVSDQDTLELGSFPIEISVALRFFLLVLNNISITRNRPFYKEISDAETTTN